eukprot:TRINITY_DN1374_c0_g1_i1.p1 TRINITY_DN1374_c0_g1~~TRINITY_DN1374_c0_g1_i1.p1  ORF type:complete len:327 (+),score=52.99 TRINITY_DN1374_c0_g1_i1:77-982(+)
MAGKAALLVSLYAFRAVAQQCDCGWTSSCGPRACLDCKDDGSTCYRFCCGAHPSPAPPPSPPSPPAPPGPAPAPPGPAPAGLTAYCPNTAQDFNVDYGSPQFSGSGWRIQGGARVSSKTSFNLAGGSVEFDMDLSNAHGGVNNNVYATYPVDGHSYCDSGGSAPGCAEYDWTENNGNCAQATTWHHDRGGSEHGGEQYVGGLSNNVHVKVTWNNDGSRSHVSVGGNNYDGEGFADVMAQHGLVIYSSQWTGWVPGSCGGDGNLQASSYAVENLRIVGRVVQGPVPAKCSSMLSAANTTLIV